MNADAVEEGNVRIPAALLQEFKSRNTNTLIEAESTTRRFVNQDNTVRIPRRKPLNQETSLNIPRRLQTETVSTEDFEKLLILALKNEGQEHSVLWKNEPSGREHHTEAAGRRILGIETTVKWEREENPYEVESEVPDSNGLHVPTEGDIDRISQTATPDIDRLENHASEDLHQLRKATARIMIDEILKSPSDEVLDKAFGFFSGSLGEFLVDREFNALAMLSLAVVYFSRSELAMTEHYFVGAVKILEGNIFRNEGWRQLLDAVRWMDRISSVYEPFRGKIATSLVWMEDFMSRVGTGSEDEEVRMPQTRMIAISLRARLDLIKHFGLQYEGAHESDCSGIVGSDEDFLSALAQAFQKIDYKLVDALFLDGSILSRNTESGSKDAIYSAIKNNSIAYTAALISYGSCIEESIRRSYVALSTAIGSSATQVLEFLLRCGVDPNDWNNGEHSPLVEAVNWDHKEMVRLLLAHGADPNFRGHVIDAPKVTSEVIPLKIAIWMNCQISIVELLLEYGAEISSEESRKLSDKLVHKAALLGRQELISLLFKTGADLNAEDDKETRLHLAVRKCYDRVVDALCENGADVNAKTAKGDTSLHLAIQCGVVSNESLGWLAFDMEQENNPLLRIIGSLIAYNADLQAYNEEGLPPIFLALKTGNLVIAKYLLQSTPQLLNSKDSRGSSVLHAAAKFGHDGFLYHLLKIGASIVATDHLDRTPLHIAAENGHEVCIKNLCYSGANVEAGDYRNAKPLHLAAQNGHIAAVRQLFRDGATIDTNDNSYQTPLFYAVRGGHANVIRSLCRKGANIEARDKHYYTPLYEAIKSGQVDSVKALCEEGAEVNTTNKVGSTVYTPMDFATNTVYIKGVLKEYSASTLEELELATKKLSRYWVQEYDASKEKIPYSIQIS